MNTVRSSQATAIDNGFNTVDSKTCSPTAPGAHRNITRDSSPVPSARFRKSGHGISHQQHTYPVAMSISAQGAACCHRLARVRGCQAKIHVPRRRKAAVSPV